ncbi:MAG: OmpA family protein [Bacteroidia bacterium]|nr:OmpA family protein [Bacteroidia bacterium]
MMKSYLALFLTIIIFFPGIQAQPLAEEDYLPDDNDLPLNYAHYLLPNGLELLTIRDSSAPLLTLHAVVRGFETYETEQNDGAAWLISRLVTQANEEFFIAEMVRDEARQSGIWYNSWLNGGNLHIHLSFPPRFIHPALQWLSSVVNGPVFDVDELKKELKEVAADLQQAEEDPEYFLRKDLEKDVWGSKIYGKSLWPDYETVSRLTSEDLKQYRKANLRPDRTLIIAGGWLNSPEVKDAVDQYFSGWESPKDKSYLESEALPPVGRVLLRNELAHEPVFLAGWIGPGVAEEPRTVRQAQLFTYMSSLPGSPLHERFIQTGLATSATLEFYPGRNESLLLFRVKAEEQRAVECLKLADMEVERLKEGEYCNDSLMKVAVSRLRWQELFSREKLSGYVAELADWWAWSGRFARLSFGNEIGFLTGGDLRNFSRKYLDPFDVSSGMLCTSQVAKDLPNTSFVALVEPKDKPKEKELAVVPVEKKPSFAEEAKKLSNYQIHFELNSFVPDKDSRESLSFIAQFLNQFPQQKVYLDGHADTQGDAGYNMVLSKKRSEAVRQYLVENFRVSPDQLQVRGFGETQPAFVEDSDENRAKNRRVEVVPFKTEGGKP